tara:strand:- start:695 stop:865 length:171 start_codon:yes stop_codon:yes gene_type:complete
MERKKAAMERKKAAMERQKAAMERQKAATDDGQVNISGDGDITDNNLLRPDTFSWL